MIGHEEYDPMSPTALPDEVVSLRSRLAQGRIDPVTAASRAQRLFASAGDSVRVRWLEMELSGYAELTRATQLHALLGVPTGDQLAARVAAYRVQRGDSAGNVVEHFFVEQLADLVSASARVATATADRIELELAATQASGDRSSGDRSSSNRAAFDSDVFDRIMTGFLATLQLELGEATP